MPILFIKREADVQLVVQFCFEVKYNIINTILFCLQNTFIGRALVRKL